MRDLDDLDDVAHMRGSGSAKMGRELNSAIQLLRREPEPDDAWRANLLTAIAEAPRPERARVWTVRPWLAVAAGVVCVAVGAASVAIASRVSRGERATIASTLRAAPERSSVRFTLDAPGAQTVSLVGDFNAWSPSSLPLRRSSDGRTWVVEVPLAPGRYAYSFVVDGALASDPAAPRATDDDFGSPNSVVLVKGSGS